MYKRKLTFYLASKADFPMTVLWEKRQKNTVNLHTHDYIELVCISEGSATHRLQGENFPIRRGSIFIIPREVSHGYNVHENENLSLYNILYQPENLPFDQLDLNHIPGFKQLFMPLQNATVIHFEIGEKDMAEITSLLEQFIRESEENKAGSRSCCLALMMLIMCKLARLYTGNLPPEAPQESVIRQVQEFLNIHPPSECTINKLSKIAHMSRSNLLKLFKNSTGLSPRQYQLQRQLHKACNALKETELPIAVIAENCGFVDTNYFSRLFHKHIGVSPRQYRKENK